MMTTSLTAVLIILSAYRLVIARDTTHSLIGANTYPPS